MNIINDPGLKQDTYVGTINNPAFQIDLVPLDNRSQQTNDTSSGETDVKFKVGDIVFGYSIKNNNIYTGRILSINNEKKIIIIFNDNFDKEIELDMRTCKKQKESKNNNNNLPFTYEKKVLTYSEFLKTNKI